MASWWDEDVADMIESGFFKTNRGDRAFEDSVIDYAAEVGLPAYPG